MLDGADNPRHHRTQHDRVRLVESGQIIKISLLLIFDKLLLGSGLENQNISLDEISEALPPRPVFLQRFLLDCEQGNGKKEDDKESFHGYAINAGVKPAPTALLTIDAGSYAGSTSSPCR